MLLKDSLSAAAYALIVVKMDLYRSSEFALLKLRAIQAKASEALSAAIDAIYLG